MLNEQEIPSTSSIAITFTMTFTIYNVHVTSRNISFLCYVYFTVDKYCERFIIHLPKKLAECVFVLRIYEDGNFCPYL